jgi:hypothetical protein
MKKNIELIIVVSGMIWVENVLTLTTSVYLSLKYGSQACQCSRVMRVLIFSASFKQTFCSSVNLSRKFSSFWHENSSSTPRFTTGRSCLTLYVETRSRRSYLPGGKPSLCTLTTSKWRESFSISIVPSGRDLVMGRNSFPVSATTFE